MSRVSSVKSCMTEIMSDTKSQAEEILIQYWDKSTAVNWGVANKAVTGYISRKHLLHFMFLQRLTLYNVWPTRKHLFRKLSRDVLMIAMCRAAAAFAARLAWEQAGDRGKARRRPYKVPRASKGNNVCQDIRCQSWESRDIFADVPSLYQSFLYDRRGSHSAFYGPDDL